MNNKPNIKSELADHNLAQVVKIIFEFNEAINNQLRKTTQAPCSQSMKCWYIPHNEFNLNTFYEKFRELAYLSNEKHKTQKLNFGNVLVRIAQK